jgi:hypothetical protein
MSISFQGNGMQDIEEWRPIKIPPARRPSRAVREAPTAKKTMSGIIAAFLY